MPTFNPTLQQSFNGPITVEFQERIQAARNLHHFTWWELAEPAGMSGSYVGNIARYPNGGHNVATALVARLALVIECLEAAPEGTNHAALVAQLAQLTQQVQLAPLVQPTTAQTSEPQPTIDQAIRDLARGLCTTPDRLSITFRPRPDLR